MGKHKNLIMLVGVFVLGWLAGAGKLMPMLSDLVSALSGLAG